MHVYRIEWPDGRGFYASDRFDFSLMDFENDSYRHPDPYQDSAYALDKLSWLEMNPGLRIEDQRFAFKTLQSLRRWFYDDDWVQRMHDAGCILCTYEVDPRTVIIGRAQMTFHSPTAKRIRREPLGVVLEMLHV